MPLMKMKPTSAGRRAVVRVVTPGPAQGAPERRSSRRAVEDAAGRNNYGHITTRHQGGGHKQQYRLIDFRRNKDGIPAQGRARSSTTRTAARTSRCCATPTASAATSSRRAGVAVGAQLMSGVDADQAGQLRCRCATSRSARRIHCIEMMPGKGAQLARSAGTSRRSCSPAKAATRSCACAPARSARCTSTAARRSARSATRSTARVDRQGRRATAGAASARRCAASRMNPVDHPHGGGEVKTAAAAIRSARGARPPRATRRARTSAAHS